MNTFLIKYIFYISSITDPPSGQIFVLGEDSVIYWDYTEYKTKKILYKKNNIIVVKEGWIIIFNDKMKINSFKRRETIEYKIRKIGDGNFNEIKDKRNLLY